MTQHEEDMELSFAIARSKDKTCGICMEVRIIITRLKRHSHFKLAQSHVIISYKTVTVKTFFCRLSWRKNLHRNADSVYYPTVTIFSVYHVYENGDQRSNLKTKLSGKKV